MESRVNGERRLVTLAGFVEATGLAIDNTELVMRDGLLRIRLQREQQVLLRSFEIARAVLGDAQIDARRAQFRCRRGDPFEQRDALVMPALLQLGQCRLVISAHVPADARLLGNRETDFFLDLYARGRRLRRGRCAGGDQRCG